MTRWLHGVLFLVLDLLATPGSVTHVLCASQPVCGSVNVKGGTGLHRRVRLATRYDGMNGQHVAPASRHSLVCSFRTNAR